MHALYSLFAILTQSGQGLSIVGDGCQLLLHQCDVIWGNKLCARLLKRGVQFIQLFIDGLEVVVARAQLIVKAGNAQVLGQTNYF